MSNINLLKKTLTISLEKAGFNPANLPKMEVKFLVDKSGSMHGLYRNGWVQNTIDLFLAAALKFDDDGKLQIGFFNNSFKQTKDVEEKDAGRYIKDKGIEADGGTCFAGGLVEFKFNHNPVNKGFFGGLFGKKAEKPATPVYLAMLTDGDCNDKRAFEDECKDLENTFLQIIAIGSGVSRSYLDGVASRYKNVSVIYLPNPEKVTEGQFYDMLLNDELKEFIK